MMSGSNSLNNSIVCCFPLEVKVRDLDARLYLALKFVRKGFSCLIGSKTGVHDYIYSHKNQYVYFDKGLTGTDGDFCEKLIQNGAVIISLDEEGGVFNKGYENLLIRYNDNTLKYRKLVCVWGEKQKNIILNNSNYITEDNIVVTGHPRFDLRKPCWAPFYEKLRKIDASQQYILFNLAFGLFNNQMLRSTYENWFRTVNPECDFENFVAHNSELEEYQGKLFKYFTDLIIKISLKFPSLTIVVRPHPVENINVYESLFAEYSNVKVTNEGSAQEWIIGSLLVVHHDCTTAIESFIFGKEIISYCPIFDEDLVQEIPVKVSRVVIHSDDIINTIEKRAQGITYTCNNDEMLRKSNVLRQIIANIDFDSSEKIIKAVKDKIETFDFVSSKASSQQKTSIRKKFLRTACSFKTNLLKCVRGTNKSNIVSKNKFPGLSKTEIVRRVKLFCEIETICPSINVKKVDSDTYLLFKKECK